MNTAECFLQGVSMETPLALPLKTKKSYRFSGFQLDHIIPSATPTQGDTCKQTCKLECHSGAPFRDLQEEVPESIVC